LNTDGTLGAAGSLLGANYAVGDANNLFTKLIIDSALGEDTWEFPTAFLNQQPFTLPLGTERSLVDLNWRAIAYTNSASGELISPDVKLWNH